MKNLMYLAVFALLLSNCANDSEDDLIDQPNNSTEVTYTLHVKSIIDTNCVSCHSNPPVNGANTALVTYNNVKSGVENNNLISKIQGNGPGALMPLGGPMLPQNLIDLIIQWEADGFIE